MIEMRTFSEEEYHQFFKGYVSDPMMDPSPFHYNREQVSRSYLYNHGGFRSDYVHMGIFSDNIPVGSFQLKRMDPEKRSCEFGIILQNDKCKNQGIGTEAIRLGMKLARDQYGMKYLIGDTMGRNKRMIHVFEKLGFTLMERIPASFELADGTKEDRLVYRINLTEVE